MTSASSYPVRLEAELQPNLSRWPWLFKWLLLIPHLIVLGLLWTAFVLLTVVRFPDPAAWWPLPAPDLRLQPRSPAH